MTSEQSCKHLTSPTSIRRDTCGAQTTMHSTFSTPTERQHSMNSAQNTISNLHIAAEAVWLRQSATFAGTRESEQPTWATAASPAEQHIKRSTSQHRMSAQVICKAVPLRRNKGSLSASWRPSRDASHTAIVQPATCCEASATLASLRAASRDQRT
jgi:hypothetical protein